MDIGISVVIAHVGLTGGIASVTIEGIVRHRRDANVWTHFIDKIVDIGGVIGIIAVIFVFVIRYLFKRWDGLALEHRDVLAKQAEKCVECVREHEKAYDGMVDAFGERLRSVYQDMRIEMMALRAENMKIQEATTQAIIKTGDSLNNLTNLVNRLVGMLDRRQNGGS
ncbi:MAG: hypothetical protein A2Y38_04145 [Spirochaetes bacterium GWB1_59_5]|nr:MAG: hypothetical protein A2Y38_04145 [Spirochaetes bacterium GWB1_59_5]